MAKKKTLRQKAQQAISRPGRFLNSAAAQITGGRALEKAKEEDKHNVPRKFLTTKELEGFKPSANAPLAGLASRRAKERLGVHKKRAKK